MYRRMIKYFYLSFFFLFYRFYNFIGMKSEQVPFTINFITSVKADSAYHLINPPSYPCSKPVDVNRI